MEKYQVYMLLDRKTNEFYYNVAIVDSLVGLVKYAKEIGVKYEALGEFYLKDNEMECFVDDENMCEIYGIAKVTKDLIM